MRLEDMRDAKARFARHIDINIDIGSWIENGSDPFIIVSEQVGKLRDAFSLNGFKNERHDVQLNRGLMKFNKIERAYFWVAHASRVSGLGVSPKRTSPRLCSYHAIPNRQKSSRSRGRARQHARARALPRNESPHL